MVASDDAAWTHYSFFERAVHRLAFAHPVLQKALGEIDEDVFASKGARPEMGAPVLVTGLPRAGTTLMLELLMNSGAFATYTYRQMPFVLAPLLWDRITSRFRKDGEAVERAHGDGMEITFDSPEAFEEVVWLAFHGRSYVKLDHLIPLDRLPTEASFKEFFENLTRRLAMADGSEAPQRRYLSKNNANIGRLKTIEALFPDARTVICLRHPFTHIASLKRQHERFLEIHSEDRFAADYMRWIGHFDFGVGFRPIDFAGRGHGPAARAPDHAFWLQYWVEAYRYALDAAGEGAVFFCYENLLQSPEETLSGLATRLDLPAEEMAKGASRVRTSGIGDPAAPADVPAALIDEALDLYQRLKARAV